MGRAGYRTIHIGKYLNEYGEDDPTEVPKGWDDWYGGVDPTTYDYYGMTINHNGEPQDLRAEQAELLDRCLHAARRAGDRQGGEG